jgi:long-chain acyl-CoA synthetase
VKGIGADQRLRIPRRGTPPASVRLTDTVVRRAGAEPGVVALRRRTDDGEIEILGPNVFPGYWRNDGATGEVLDPGGWLKTGDTGIVDDEGFLQVTGRKKELIVTAGGTNVAPAVLEDRLRANPLISECMVVGDGRPYIACLVTLTPTLKLRRNVVAKEFAADIEALCSPAG